MKKFLLIILSILCMCFTSLGVACASKDKAIKQSFDTMLRISFNKYSSPLPISSTSILPWKKINTPEASGFSFTVCKI